LSVRKRLRSQFSKRPFANFQFFSCKKVASTFEVLRLTQISHRLCRGPLCRTSGETAVPACALPGGRSPPPSHPPPVRNSPPSTTQCDSVTASSSVRDWQHLISLLHSLPWAWQGPRSSPCGSDDASASSCRRSTSHEYDQHPCQ